MSWFRRKIECKLYRRWFSASSWKLRLHERRKCFIELSVLSPRSIVNCSISLQSWRTGTNLLPSINRSWKPPFGSQRMSRPASSFPLTAAAITPEELSLAGPPASDYIGSEKQISRTRKVVTHVRKSSVLKRWDLERTGYRSSIVSIRVSQTVRITSVIIEKYAMLKKPGYDDENFLGTSRK